MDWLKHSVIKYLNITIIFVPRPTLKSIHVLHRPHLNPKRSNRLRLLIFASNIAGKHLYRIPQTFLQSNILQHQAVNPGSR